MANTPVSFIPSAEGGGGGQGTLYNVDNAAAGFGPFILPPVSPGLLPYSPAQVLLILGHGGWTRQQKKDFCRVNHIKAGGSDAELNARLEPILVRGLFSSSALVACSLNDARFFLFYFISQYVKHA